MDGRGSTEVKGFFSSLFDFSFTHLVATKLVRLYYGVAMVLTGLGTLMFLLMTLGGAWSQGFGAFLGALIVAPVLSAVLFLFWLIFHRLFCEVLVVLFRIAESLSSIDQKTAPDRSGP